MKKLNNKKGFTLAELLIVIAIIAALVAIMIPTFGGQVEKAREAADIANLRAAYADATVKYLNGEGTGENKKTVAVDVAITQTDAGWKNSDLSSLPFTITGSDDKNGPKAEDGIDTATFTFSDTEKPTCALSKK